MQFVTRLHQYWKGFVQRRTRKIHRMIGEAVEHIFADRVETLYDMLAYHYLMAKNLKKADLYMKLPLEKPEKSHAGFEDPGLKFPELALRRLKYEESVSEQVEAGDFDSTALVHRAGK